MIDNVTQSVQQHPHTGFVNGERVYANVTDEMRHNLIDLIDREGMTCRDAAERLGMPYNTAKVIKRVWKKEGRVRAVPPHLKRMFAWYKRDRDELRQRKGNTRKFRELMAFISQLENDPAGLPTLYKSRRKVPPSV